MATSVWPPITSSVGGDPGSEQSKDLRKAIATVLSVYRDEAHRLLLRRDCRLSSTIPSPTPPGLLPSVTDAGYKVAFSVDVNGNDIYTSGMTTEEKYDAALQAALGYFEAAGYTVDERQADCRSRGRQAGVRWFNIRGGGTGRPPHLHDDLRRTLADALAKIGFNLIVNDLADASDAVGLHITSGMAEMWCAAWQRYSLIPICIRSTTPTWPTAVAMPTADYSLLGHQRCTDPG